MSPFPTILALEDTRVYVCSTDSCNKLADVEAPVDEYFSTAPALDVLNVNPHNSHVRLG